MSSSWSRSCGSTARAATTADEAAATILVVDDVPENVRLLEAVLAARGYEVVGAHDGAAERSQPYSGRRTEA
jgi:PleD family two-component response regulator